MEKKYEVIFCIVNAGFADTVMDAARKEGASGGTVLKGRGLAGYVYTQVSDIEEETNGMLTYDRRVHKFDDAGSDI